MTEPLRDRLDSYEPRADKPAIGSRWVWEPDEPHARERIKVLEVLWNGSEWWVRTTGSGSSYWNDLARFWEACVPDPDPNEVPVGGEIIWHGRPSFTKGTPRWKRREATIYRWGNCGDNRWRRLE